MKRRKAILGMLASMLALSACSFSNTDEIKQYKKYVAEGRIYTA